MAQRDAALNMKTELERMRQKFEEIKLRKGAIATRAVQAQAGAGSEGLGARGGTSAFDNFRRMEEKIEGREAETSAMAEVDEALRGGGRPRRTWRPGSGSSKGRLARARSRPTSTTSAALKKRIRV